jgi:hypothetical protein
MRYTTFRQQRQRQLGIWGTGCILPDPAADPVPDPAADPGESLYDGDREPE